MTNLFETATRRKYRFQLGGNLTAEDLWDLNQEALDTIFKSLNAQLKEQSEESLSQVKSEKATELMDKIDIVKYIYNIKAAEKLARQEAKERRERKQKLMALIEEKQNENLKSMPLDQLEAMLKAMGE